MKAGAIDMGRLPKVKTSNRILIVCEGYEEYDYLNRLKECDVWSHDVSVNLKNAKSIDEIIARYEYEYQNGNYKLIVIFCDTEKEPYTKFLSLREQINEFHGNDASKHIVFFANPCTMQIILSHFSKVSLISNLKSDNAYSIERSTGVKDYKATERQRLSIMNKITKENYADMKRNISSLNIDYKKIPSSNCKFLFDGLEKDPDIWIKSVNQKIEKE